MEELPINGNPTINGSWVVAFTQPIPPAATQPRPLIRRPRFRLQPQRLIGLQLPLNQPQLQLQLLATGFEFCTTRRR